MTMSASALDTQAVIAGSRELAIQADVSESRDHVSKVAPYAEFDGAQGRDVYFRPDRYQRSDLGPVSVSVTLTDGDRSYVCELHDVSQNGVAFEWPAAVPVELGATLEEIIITFDEHEAYRGQARVSSVRRNGHHVIAGVSLLDTLMNLDDVLHMRDIKAWSAGTDNQPVVLSSSTWRVVGQERFKALVADLRLFLEDAQVRFAELEASLPWHIVNGEHDSPAREALIASIRDGFAADVIQASNDIDRALRSASRQEREALREYSVRHLHALLMQSPWMHRARHKPLGYPGDFEVMNGLYANHFNGPTLFAKAINLSFVSTPAAVAVRTRKDLIKQRLSALLDAPPREDKVRVLSIAAGPTQEIFELLQERTSLAVPLQIVLFEQDKRALNFSYVRLKRLVESKWRGQVSLIHLHDSIKHLLRGSDLFSGYGAFDAVYSCGLFDYLRLHTATSLCRRLYDLVAPGGTLYVGNMVPMNPSRWFMELHLDWFLIYREHAEMLELARTAAPDAQSRILEEPTGVNPFVALTRE